MIYIYIYIYKTARIKYDTCDEPEIANTSCVLRMRRIIWVVILLINTGLFIYIMTMSLQKLLSYPSNINVQVTYSDSLPFAAITICNENMYR